MTPSRPAAILLPLVLLLPTLLLTSCEANHHHTTPGFSAWTEGGRGIGWLRGTPETQLVVGVRLPDRSAAVSSSSGVDVQIQDEHMTGRITERLVFRPESGAEITIEVATRDAQRPLDVSVLAAGKSLDLADGRLLLIDARAGQPTVVQLPAGTDLTALEARSEAEGAADDASLTLAREVLDQAAEQHPEAAFFR